jgi:hypothetical protein
MSVIVHDQIDEHVILEDLKDFDRISALSKLSLDLDLFDETLTRKLTPFIKCGLAHNLDCVMLSPTFIECLVNFAL